MNNKYKSISIIFIFMSLLFAIPSIRYLIKFKTVYNFNDDLEFCFLLTNNISKLTQTFVYFIILAILVICYLLIIKFRRKIFKNIKQIFSLIFIISFIFILVIPFLSSDVFYYMGIGRLFSKYHQNPYYYSIRETVDNNIININNDSVIRQRL